MYPFYLGVADVLHCEMFPFDIEPAGHLPKIRYHIRMGAAALMSKEISL